MANGKGRGPRRVSRPVLFHSLWSGGIAVVATVLLWWLLTAHTMTWYSWLFCWLVAVNVTAFGYYGYDKSRARRASARVPERVLHGLALFGGSVGAYAGMEVFRHKTVKGGFRLVFWTIVLLQVALIVWVVRRLYFSD
ncbi:MAG: DUF1294 domain-containing protein [Gemmataceae bacterium]|nr:DUF1294 domain-containing protein [Gemmataceae bacterium]